MSKKVTAWWNPEKLLRQSWVRAINQVKRREAGGDFRITDYTRVCESHFKPKDINVSMGIGRKTLKQDTITKFKNIEVEKATRKSPKKEAFA